jgi:hypothetical protein
MTVAEDIERIGGLVEESGNPEHRAWVERWAHEMEGAAEAADDELGEDLYDALIIWERAVLRPPGRLIPVDELLRDLGFDPAEFGIDDAECSGSVTP